MICKVSVIIPVYNAAPYLRECLGSIINQTLKEIEIICVDDGSTDNSLEILQEYARKDNRIKVLEQSNQHAGVARNNGLAHATGEYIHFLDADDWVASFAYEELYFLAKKKNVSVVKFRSYSYDNSTQSVRSTYYTDIAGIAPEYFDTYLSWEKNATEMVRLPDSPWSGFYERNFLQKRKIYFDNLTCANDTGFFYRCLAAAERVYLSSNRYVYYRQNVVGSLVSRRAAHFECQTAVYDIVCPVITNLPASTQALIKNRLICSCFSWYLSCLKQPSNTPYIINKLHHQMKHFFRHTADVELLDRAVKRRYVKAKRALQKFLRKKQLSLYMRLWNRKIHRKFP